MPSYIKNKIYHPGRDANLSNENDLHLGIVAYNLEPEV